MNLKQILLNKAQRCWKCGLEGENLMYINHKYVCNICNHRLAARAKVKRLK